MHVRVASGSLTVAHDNQSPLHSRTSPHHSRSPNHLADPHHHSAAKAIRTVHTGLRLCSPLKSRSPNGAALPLSPTVVECLPTSERNRLARTKSGRVLKREAVADVLMYRQQYPAFHKTLDDIFPHSFLDHEFLAITDSHLIPLGFNKASTIPCVSLCRDEMCWPLFEEICDHWCRSNDYGAFNMASLAGLLSLGCTGLKAANSHSPKVGGYERYLYVAMPHISIDDSGVVGSCMRPGREEDSHACGALQAAVKDFKTGRMDTRPDIDKDDVEMSILRMKLYDCFPPGSRPDLVEVTKATMELIRKDIQRITERTITDCKNCHYAVITGVQIHAPEGHSYIYPGSAWAVINGKHMPLKLSSSDVHHQQLNAAWSVGGVPVPMDNRPSDEAHENVQAA